MQGTSIPEEDKACYYIDLPSPFPVENRRVYLLNTVKLSNEALRSNEKETMSKLVASITSIMDKHNNERGLILVPSYALADLIYSYLPKEYRSRLLLTRWKGEEEEERK